MGEDKMFKIEWDDTPISPEKTPVQKWDEWFALVGLTDVWVFLKNVFADDHDRLMMWASIIELDRICTANEKRDAIMSN